MRIENIYEEVAPRHDWCVIMLLPSYIKRWQWKSLVEISGSQTFYYESMVLHAAPHLIPVSNSIEKS